MKKSTLILLTTSCVIAIAPLARGQAQGQGQGRGQAQEHKLVYRDDGTFGYRGRRRRRNPGRRDTGPGASPAPRSTACQGPCSPSMSGPGRFIAYPRTIFEGTPTVLTFVCRSGSGQRPL